MAEAQTWQLNHDVHEASALLEKQKIAADEIIRFVWSDESLTY